MNAPLLTAELFAPQARAATSPPLRVAPALNRFRIAVQGRAKRAKLDDERQARRGAVIALIGGVLGRDDADGGRRTRQRERESQGRLPQYKYIRSQRLG